jgi:hypothetical protein
MMSPAELAVELRRLVAHAENIETRLQHLILRVDNAVFEASHLQSIRLDVVTCQHDMKSFRMVLTALNDAIDAAEKAAAKTAGKAASP